MIPQGRQRKNKGAGQGRSTFCEKCQIWFGIKAENCPRCRENKTCYKCKIYQPINNFYATNDPNRPDKHTSLCKTCSNANSYERDKLRFNKGISPIRKPGANTFCAPCNGWYNHRAKGCPYCRTEKACDICKHIKPLSEFYARTVSKDKKDNWCMVCRNRQRLKKVYKLTDEEFDILQKTQVNGCTICGILEDGENPFGRLNIDHDHATGRVRGLLCSTCNRGLGLFKDNLSLLIKAVEYLSYKEYEQ